MRYLLIAVRLPLMLAHVVLGVALCLAFPRNGAQSWFRQHVVPAWLYGVGKIMGVHVTVVGHSAPPPVYLVANHISWLDIVVIGSLQPTSFLSKNEVARWPVINYLARHSGTLFIERGKGVNGAMQSLNDCLQQGMSTAIFPEGTTTTGQTVQNFYPRLFAAVIDSPALIQPLAIVYPSPKAPTEINPIVPLKSQPNFMASIFAVMGQTSTNVVVRYAEPMNATGSRKDVAQQAHQAVSLAVKETYGN